MDDPSDYASAGVTLRPTGTSSAKWHATGCPAPRSTSAGSSCAHFSCAFQHRVRNRQPDGGSTGLGTSPLQHDARTRPRSSAGSGTGTADSNACVYGMLRVRVHVLGGTVLHDLAEVHHRDLVGDVAHDREVVRDEQVREAQPVLQVLEQVHDAGLDRHVERRYRLVEHEHRRLERDRTCDADALALTTRELVRVAVPVLGVQPDECQQLAHLRLAVARRHGGSSAAHSTIAATVMRGSSDAYGSWNTICIRLRYRRSLAVRQAREGRRLRIAPSPTSASSNRSTHRPTVDFPEPDSPTNPSVRPCVELERHAGDRLHDDSAAAAAYREVLHEVVHREHR